MQDSFKPASLPRHRFRPWKSPVRSNTTCATSQETYGRLTLLKDTVIDIADKDEDGYVSANESVSNFSLLIASSSHYFMQKRLHHTPFRASRLSTGVSFLGMISGTKILEEPSHFWMTWGLSKILCVTHLGSSRPNNRIMLCRQPCT